MILNIRKLFTLSVIHCLPFACDEEQTEAITSLSVCHSSTLSSPARSFSAKMCAKRIMITGVSGFLGRLLFKHLDGSESSQIRCVWTWYYTGSIMSLRAREIYGDGKYHQSTGRSICTLWYNRSPNLASYSRRASDRHRSSSGEPFGNYDWYERSFFGLTLMEREMYSKHVSRTVKPIGKLQDLTRWTFVISTHQMISCKKKLISDHFCKVLRGRSPRIVLKSSLIIRFFAKFSQDFR